MWEELVNVRMVDESAGPGLQHSQRTPFSAETFRVCRQLPHRLPRTLKEHRITPPLVGAHPCSQRIGKCEGDQRVGGVEKQTLALLGQPLLSLTSTALRTVTIVA